MTGRAALRAILGGEACIYLAPVFDPISGRIASDLGFEAGILGGSIASHIVLGDPDHILMSLGELAEQVRRITRASDIPLMVDADHGFGNALNARRTVAELDMAGAAGCSIEDTALPRPYGGGGGLIPLDEAEAKMRAAAAGRRSADFTVAARTRFEDSVEAFQARIRAYSGTGVDAIFLTGVRSREVLEAGCAATTLPVILGAARDDLDDKPYLRDLGVRLVVRGHASFAAAVEAIFRTLYVMRHGTEAPETDAADLLKRYTRSAEFAADIRTYLGGD